MFGSTASIVVVIVLYSKFSDTANKKKDLLAIDVVSEINTQVFAF